MKIELTAEQIRAVLRLASREEAPAAQGGAAARLPDSVLERVITLRARGRRPAIVAIEGGACSGCHVRLPTMIEQDAARSSALFSCPQCRRLLYARAALGDRARGGPSRTAPGSGD